jgi:NAD(P)-dependent dehydrogenase (short-subunit alcohol dehydrogenase family)
MSTYVITGANRGIGLELARQARAAGHDVVATTRHPVKSKELAELDVRMEELDVADPRSVAEFHTSLGHMPVDVLINNAGIGVQSVDFETVDPVRMMEFFRVNTIGALRVTQALLPNLRAGAEKRVVQMTSRMGSIADNTSGGSYAYRASKAALNMVTRSLALDFAAEGFVCMVLHPGWVQTRMGGGGAPVIAEVSVSGMLHVIDRAAADDSGGFFDFTGASVPW